MHLVKDRTATLRESVALDSGSCDLRLFGTVSAKTKRRAIPQVVSCIRIDRFVAAQGSGSQSCLGKAKI
jgi:hypothetical protein